MKYYFCGPVSFEHLKGQLTEYAVQYTHFLYSNYGYALFDDERVFGMGLLYSWSRLQERLFSFEDLLAACDNAKAGRIKIKDCKWNWNTNTSPDEIEQVLGVFLHLYGTDLSSRVGKDFSGQQIVSGMQFFFDDILDTYSQVLSEGKEHDLYDDRGGGKRQRP